MKNKLFLITITFLCSSFTLNAMDFEQGGSQEDLQTIPLEITSQINQFKTAFTQNNPEQLIPMLQELKNQPETLRMIKNWLKDQKVNSDQEQLIFANNNKYKPYVLANGILNFFAGLFNSINGNWPLALITYLITAGTIGWLIWIERQNCKLSKSIQPKIGKNNKIRILISSIRNIRTTSNLME